MWRLSATLTQTPLTRAITWPEAASLGGILGILGRVFPVWVWKTATQKYLVNATTATSS